MAQLPILFTQMWQTNAQTPEARTGALAVAFTLGILAAAHASPVLCLLIAAAIAAVTAIFFRGSARTVGLILAAVFLTGSARYAVYTQIPADDISLVRGKITSFEGTVAGDPDLRPSGDRLVIDVDQATTKHPIPVSGQVMVRINLSEGSPLPLEYGDHVRIQAAPYIPGGATNPGQFSWKDYLDRQGIHSCASVTDTAQIEVLPGNSGNPIARAAIATKHYLTASIQKIHTAASAPVVVGMTLGTYAYLPADTLDSFTRTGTLHVLAASGFNCYILAWLCTSLLRLLRLKPSSISLIAAAVLIFYLIMVGFRPSLVRATVMSGLWLLAVPLRHVPNVRCLFFVAVVTTLMMRPTDIFDVGFQLSFAAVWALITSGSLIENALQSLTPRSKPKKQNAIWQWIRGELTSAAYATITVTLFTAPIVAYHFNYISLVSLPANIAIALAVVGIFAIGLFSMVAAPLPCLGAVVGFAGSKMTAAMLAVVTSLGSLRYSAITIPSPGPLAIAGYYVLLHAGLDYLRSRVAQK